MVINVADALSAYRSSIKGLDASKESVGGIAGSQSFGDVLGGVLNNTVDSLKNAEKVSMAAVQGKASINDIVSAVSSAEVALQTVVSIRDRLISAYQELMRSGI